MTDRPNRRKALGVKFLSLTVVSLFVVAGVFVIMTGTSESDAASDNSVTFTAGSGTHDDPWVIATQADFKNIAKTEYYDTNKPLYFVLCSDIVLTDYQTIGLTSSGNKEFNSVFYGNGHSIQYSASGSEVGLFYLVGKQGIVRDLTVNATVTATACAGGIASTNNGLIDNCVVNGSISAVQKGAKDHIMAGGIAGHNGNQGTIKNSINYATVRSVSSFSLAGGITARIGTSGATIEDCINHGNVYAGADGDGFYLYSKVVAGGIVGHASGPLTVNRVLSYNEVMATTGDYVAWEYRHAGAILGDRDGSATVNVTDAYAKNNIVKEEYKPNVLSGRTVSTYNRLEGTSGTNFQNTSTTSDFGGANYGSWNMSSWYKNGAADPEIKRPSNLILQSTIVAHTGSTEAVTAQFTIQYNNGTSETTWLTTMKAAADEDIVSFNYFEAVIAVECMTNNPYGLSVAVTALPIFVTDASIPASSLNVKALYTDGKEFPVTEGFSASGASVKGHQQFNVTYRDAVGTGMAYFHNAGEFGVLAYAEEDEEPAFYTCPVGVTVTIEEVSRGGYDFDGWYTKSDGGTLLSEDNPYTFTPRSDMVMYAQWDEEDKGCFSFVIGTIAVGLSAISIPVVGRFF